MFLRAKASRVIFTLLTCSLVLMSEVVRASNITLQGSFTLRDQRRSSFHQGRAFLAWRHADSRRKQSGNVTEAGR